MIQSAKFVRKTCKKKIVTKKNCGREGKIFQSPLPRKHGICPSPRLPSFKLSELNSCGNVIESTEWSRTLTVLSRDPVTTTFWA